MVSSLIVQITGAELEFAPECFLLNMIKTRKERVLIGNLLIAAKLLLAKYLKTDILP